MLWRSAQLSVKFLFLSQAASEQKLHFLRAGCQYFADVPEFHIVEFLGKGLHQYISSALKTVDWGEKKM